MKNHTHILKWATDCLVSKGYFLQHSPEILMETPWSNVIRFPTSKEYVYLKQTPPPLFLEPKIMQLLADRFHASVPTVIAINEDLHCFLMKDAGQTLRQYLKTEFQPDLLRQAVIQHIALQREIEKHIASFLTLGVPDWRLDEFPKLYDQIINQTEFLKADGMTDKELQILHEVSPKIAEQCELLSQFQIPETLVQPDFNSNNVLIDPNTKKMTFIDLGETVITHPFFSLHTFLSQAIIHHGVKEWDQAYHHLQDAGFENWLNLATKKQLLEGFMLAKKLYPIYSAFGYYRLMLSVDLPALNLFYANRPNRFSGYFREYIASS